MIFGKKFVIKWFIFLFFFLISEIDKKNFLNANKIIFNTRNYKLITWESYHSFAEISNFFQFILEIELATSRQMKFHKFYIDAERVFSFTVW